MLAVILLFLGADVGSWAVADDYPPPASQTIALPDLGPLQDLEEGTPLAHTTAATRSFVTDQLSADGTPETVRYRVVLPKGFRPDKKYPVVFFLHGLGDNMEMMERIGALSTMDALVDSGRTGFILVSPDGDSKYWMNGARNGLRWEDVITGPLRQNFFAAYPAAKTAARDQLIAGISMGGSSAVRIAIDHPGLYGAVAAHSPVFRDETAAQEFPDIFGHGKDYAERDPFSLLRSGKGLPSVIRMDGGSHSPTDLNGRAIQFGEEFHLPACDLHFGDTAGDHADSYWSKHLPEYFDWYARFFDQAQTANPAKNPDCP